MLNYLLLFLAAIFLACKNMLTKQYQKNEGHSLDTCMVYHMMQGFLRALLFWVVGGFQLQITPFALAMAVIFSSCIIIYTVLGFKVMEEESVSAYTFFLMTGGMILPFVWGLLFLNEQFTWIRLAGLGILTASILLVNGGIRCSGKTKILLAIIFVVNGITSIVSKEHQISVYGVGTNSFAILYGLVEGCISLVIYLFKNKGKSEITIQSNSYLAVFASVLIGGVSTFLQLNGAKEIMATVLYPIITGGTIVFTSIAGRIVYKEDLKPRAIAGLALCVVGTCMFL